MSPDADPFFEQVCTDIFERDVPLNKLADLIKHPLFIHEHVSRYDTERSEMRHETQCESTEQ